MDQNKIFCILSNEFNQFNKELYPSNAINAAMKYSITLKIFMKIISIAKFKERVVFDARI